MIFTTDRKELIAAIAIAGRVVPKKTPWPILQNLKIVTNAERVTLIGSDGDMTFEVDVPADVETEGVACLPFDPLAKFLGAARTESVKISADDLSAKVQAGRNRVGLSVANVRDYPNYTPPDGDMPELDALSFCQALRFCLAATEDSEARYYLAGVNMSEREDGVHAWGTDGKSAHKAIIHGATEIGGGATLPIAAANVALSVADKRDVIRFMIGGKGWHLARDGMRIWGKVIDGSYPDMDRVIGQFENWQEILTIPRDELSDAISIATVGAEQDSDKSRNVVLHARIGKPMAIKGFKASIGVTQAGYAEVETEAKSEFASPVSAKLLTAAIAGMDGDGISIFGCNEEGRPAIKVTPAQESATLSLTAIALGLRASVEQMGLDDVEDAA